MFTPLCPFSLIVGSAIFSHQTIHFVSPISEPNCSNIWHWQKGCQWYLDTFTRCPGIVIYHHLCNAASMALRATPNQQTDITKRLGGSLDDAGLPPGSKLLCLRHHASQLSSNWMSSWLLSLWWFPSSGIFFMLTCSGSLSINLITSFVQLLSTNPSAPSLPLRMDMIMLYNVESCHWFLMLYCPCFPVKRKTPSC